MPINYDEYASYWRKLSQHIRFVRAGNCCEWCNAPNGQYIVRSSEDPARYMVYNSANDGWEIEGNAVKWSEIPSEFHETAIKVVLTVAHLDHDKANNRFSNLAALCQRCHLTYDAQHHAENASRTRAERKHQARREAGQLSLFGD